ncbi:hypothetical protein EPZ47_00115 [Pseudomonas viciae]|uniref:Uncharacterized protein n=1 Tax=Pseudomonas viciae TaxID=2505979 RepID=A0A4P7PB27_9PSED|nr:hypothetical protein [Pseudomonas viciae]QBZ87182.1 hypothetical protein EPZ47_00115 [Pseudomonas viciae]
MSQGKHTHPGRKDGAIMVECTINNLSRRFLTYDPSSQKMEHGEVTSNYGPQNVAPYGDSRTFSIESDGLMTGCEGNFYWKVADTESGIFHVHLQNPFSGHGHLWSGVFSGAENVLSVDPTSYETSEDCSFSITVTVMDL